MTLPLSALLLGALSFSASDELGVDALRIDGPQTTSFTAFTSAGGGAYPRPQLSDAGAKHDIKEGLHQPPADVPEERRSEYERRAAAFEPCQTLKIPLPRLQWVILGEETQTAAAFDQAARVAAPALQVPKPIEPTVSLGVSPRWVGFEFSGTVVF